MKSKVKKLHQSLCELTDEPFSEAVEGEDEDTSVVERSGNLMQDQINKFSKDRNENEQQCQALQDQLKALSDAGKSLRVR